MQCQGTFDVSYSYIECQAGRWYGRSYILLLNQRLRHLCLWVGRELDTVGKVGDGFGVVYRRNLGVSMYGGRLSGRSVCGTVGGIDILVVGLSVCQSVGLSVGWSVGRRRRYRSSH